MGRTENPVPRPDSALGRLASHLRRCRVRAGLTNAALATRTKYSATTLQRAAGGAVLPTLRVVLAYEEACGIADGEARRLWEQARQMAGLRDRRRAVPPHPGKAPRPDLIADRADMSRALLDLRERSGLSYRAMEHRLEERPELGPLSRSTAQRILTRQSFPTSQRQLMALLHACAVPQRAWGDWVRAWKKVHRAQDRKESAITPARKLAARVQRTLRSLSRFSKSLYLSRDDHGVDLPVLGRVDITAFLGRLSFLNQRGDISACTQYMTVRDTRRVLTRLRTLGRAGPGQPLHGLADDFALRQEDIPDDPEDSEAGRDLPAEVMRQLCAHLESLETVSSADVRTAIELIIDTGRRPNEICKLPWQCLDREGDGSPVLVYDNTKNLRHARRLPIPGATAALIIKQQQRARARFPDTPADKLKLFPATLANPHGTKATTYEWVSAKHRAWVKGLSDFLVPTVIVDDGNRVTTMLSFDKNKIYPYAYRHTYAQRHADAGVPQDVLQSLMDHREASTTQRYYRVGEKRRREAVERVTAMQFDRHGTRVWRQAKTLLDSEHARRAIGSVQVPYGTCTEPSNVAAGGHDCPVRFRCVGCGHFRTDVSYLPDLEAYLADLLRNRERLAAFANADPWAKAEATPSDDEIARVRRLVQRVRQDLDELTDEDRAQIREAVALVRRSRGVSLGMPRVRQPLPDLRPERTG
ncbi:tyrosine-type recombinase/integrase [Streptomyces sp. NPDC006872]|uniref:tyrosine-type recombinase/integrase n=1 Tax=Streptomyces sp. NPDC006872 TaxID=3155720 RepID=UPI0033D2EDF2